MFKELSKPFQYEKIHDKTKINKHEESQGPNKRIKLKARNWKSTLKRVWKYVSYNQKLLTIVLCLVVISSILGLLGPILIGTAIDEYIMNQNSSGLVILLLGLGGVYLLYSITMWLQNYWMIGIAQQTVSSMRTQLFKKFHALPISYFDRRQHGELMSRVTNDIENISSTLNSSVIQIFSSVLTLVGTFSVMLWLSPLLTVLTLVIVPLMYLGMRWITTRTGVLFKQQQRNVGELNGFIEETISGQRVIKTFSQEQRVIDEFTIKSKRLKASGFWAQTYSGFIPKLMNALNNVSFTIVAGIGGLFVFYGQITVGVMVIFAEYARQFTRPLNDLSNQFNILLSAVAGAERVFDVLDEEEEEKDEEQATDLIDLNGTVEFRNVSFTYDKDQTLHEINFTVSPGETVALVGPTGAGKTTVINLLSRFYNAKCGTILIDGKEIGKIKRASLRRHMAFVLQDTFLFQGTIRENIRYGRLEASDDEVEQAAKLANAHSFIMKLPEQYNTLLTQDGSGISQGQKQLISIARAILANPSILILDEATSNIDTITELKIQEALHRLMQGRTCFVIAHRLNTIQNADQIIVLQEGQIIEQGTHQTLLRQKGFYHDLYHSQLTRQMV